MALTAAQRRRIPRSEWGYARGPRSNWAFPMPSKATARRIGISEAQRQRILRNAAARAAQRRTRGTYGRIAPIARRKAGGQWGRRQRRRSASAYRYRARRRASSGRRSSSGRRRRR